jgi:hypothetical protein
MPVQGLYLFSVMIRLVAFFLMPGMRGLILLTLLVEFSFISLLLLPSAIKKLLERMISHVR